jgi:hypothetical protein
MMIKRIEVLLACMLITFLVAGTVSAASTHEKRILKYEGSITCQQCHKDAAKDVVESLHYQQVAEPLFLEGWKKGETAGMMVSF